MVFIGYESGTKGYRFFDPSTKKLVISRDVIFFMKNNPGTGPMLIVMQSRHQVASLFTMSYLIEIQQ
jgi:hypothetical protein